MDIHPYFATPISQVELPDAKPLNDRLKPKLLHWEANEGKRGSLPTAVPKHAVYESDFFLFDRDDADIRRLANFCLHQVGELVMRTNNYSVEQMRNLRIFAHSWYHITRYGGYTGPHNHPMASWSGVYCVAPGTANPKFEESGVLRILDPRPNVGMYLDPGNAQLQASYGPGHLAWRQSAGQLVLFPSWLYHEVAPFWGQDERITVAFNAWIREAGAAADEPGITAS